MRVVTFFLMTVCLSFNLSGGLSVAQERDNRLMVEEGRLIYQLELAQLTSYPCDNPAVLLSEALQQANRQLFLYFPEIISQLEAAERSYITEFVVQLVDGASHEGNIILTMYLAVSAPQRLPQAFQERLELLELPLCKTTNATYISNISNELVQILQIFQQLAGKIVIATEWQPVFMQLFPPEMFSSFPISPVASSYRQDNISEVNTAAFIATPAPPTATPSTATPLTFTPSTATPSTFTPSTATPSFAVSAPENADTPVVDITQDMAIPEGTPSPYEQPSEASLLLPSVQQRAQRAPLVLDIPDVSSPAVNYPLHQPLTEAAPPSSAFRFNISTSMVNPATVSADILQSAGETSEGYLHVVGYERLPAISTLRVTNFAAPQLVIDSQRGYLAVIETNKGRIVAQLYTTLAPITVNNFVFLARYHFYDGVPFHRVVANFLAQTGDPSGTGEGTPGYTFADEINPNLSHHTAGILSMANNGVDTNGSQFFMSLQAMPWLDGKHSIFGQVIAGYEVLGRLQPTDPSEKLPAYYLEMTASLEEVQARGIILEDEVAFRELFNEALELVEGATFTTAPLPTDISPPPEPTLGDYLNMQQGKLPSEGTFFHLAGHEVALVVNAEGRKQLAVFAPDDYIERIYILQKLPTAN